MTGTSKFPRVRRETSRLSGLLLGLAFAWALIVSPLRSQPVLSVAPAVEVSWPSLPNRLYQVWASDSLTTPVWTEAGAPVVGTGAEIRRMLLRGDASHRFFRVQELEGTVTNWLAGLTELDLRPAKLTAQAGGLLAEGVRVTAAGISLDDLVTARFQFDLESQSLRLVQYQVVPQIGVFNDRFFARNVPLHPVGRTNGVAITPFANHSLFGTNITVDLDLEIGQVLNFALWDQTLEYSAELLDPDGQRQWFSIGAANNAIVADGFPILRSGTYQIRIRPRSTHPGAAMSCKFFFANNNPVNLQSAAHGATLQATLRDSTHDYAKYSMTLAQGQIVRLQPAVGTAGVGFVILNARSQKLVDLKQLPLIFEAPASGTYYLFIYKITAAAGPLNYSGTLTIGN